MTKRYNQKALYYFLRDEIDRAQKLRERLLAHPPSAMGAHALGQYIEEAKAANIDHETKSDAIYDRMDAAHKQLIKFRKEATGE